MIQTPTPHELAAAYTTLRAFCAGTTDGARALAILDHWEHEAGDHHADEWHRLGYVMTGVKLVLADKARDQQL